MACSDAGLFYLRIATALLLDVSQQRRETLRGDRGTDASWVLFLAEGLLLPSCARARHRWPSPDSQGQ